MGLDWNLKLLEKSICFFDFDNTLYRGQTRYLILDFSIYLESFAAFNSQDLVHLNSLFTSYQAGNLKRFDFAIQVVLTYYHGMIGSKEKDIDHHADKFWKDLPESAWFEYTFPLVNLIKQYSIPILISGSPIEILSHARKLLGIDEVYASRGIIRDGIYTGGMELEMATQASKTQKVFELSTNLDFNPQTSFAFGDSSSDFPLLQAVDPKNAYLLIANDHQKIEVVDKNWNLLDQDITLIEHVQDRIHTLFS